MNYKQPKGKLKIGFPLSLSAGGPSLFMKRLRHSISKQRLAQVSTFINPFTQLNIFSNRPRNIYGKPYIFRVDGIYFDKKQTKGNNETKNKPIFKGIDEATGVVFQSHFSYKLVASFHRVTHKLFDIINNGVDISFFSPYGPNKRKEIGINHKDLVFITSANWRAHKRLPAVIDFFIQFQNQSDRTCHLLILGKNANIGNINHPRIYKIGFILPEDLPAWYRTGSIFLFFSWLDNCPNSVIEAIACGLPVVCTNQGGSKELVKITKGGIVAEADEEFSFEPVDLYNPPTPNYLRILEAIHILLANYDEYANRIDKAKIDINNVAARYITFIENVISNK